MYNNAAREMVRREALQNTDEHFEGLSILAFGSQSATKDDARDAREQDVDRCTRKERLMPLPFTMKILKCHRLA